MPDQLADIASQLDAQITKMIGGGPSSSESQESPMNTEVLDILKAGGCTDPEGTLSKIEAAGFKVEKSDEPKEEEPEGDMPDFGDELAKMPMKDARAGAAKAAFGSMGK
jgi:hypothetical protein